MTSVAIVEDHPLYRDALEKLVALAEGLSVHEVASSIEELEARVRGADRPPDVVLLDLGLAGLDGVAGVARMTELGWRTLVVSATLDGRTIVSSLEAGAGGYLSKEARAEEILVAIDAVVAGHTYVSPMLAAQVRAGRSAQADDPVLSERERDILRLLARGDKDQGIAAELGLSVSTIRSHLDRIRDKTGRRRRAELTRFAIEVDLL
ncbi:MAG: response regulator [Phycicoccus sp.]